MPIAGGGTIISNDSENGNLLNIKKQNKQAVSCCRRSCCRSLFCQISMGRQREKSIIT